ncbi:MupG family TIM beta-alpha barrel fold protein [Lachnospiraceae bacterium 54-53]
MHKLGISVYPEHSTKSETEAYIKLAAGYGFSRIFTCLLSVKKAKEELLKEFGEFMDLAHNHGFEVAVDTNPAVFAYLGATPFEIKAFADMGVDIIRLDGHFGEMEDIAVTRNPYGIPVEFNGSANMDLDLLTERGADRWNMVTCHNFYPQRYTGLGWKRFLYLTEKYKKSGFRTAAFVSSQNEDTFGPWPVKAGLPTCELHRGLPIDLQVRHLLASNMIDDVIIGNCFATEEELKSMSEVDRSKVTFRIKLEETCSGEELGILFEYRHLSRGDSSDYMMRSSGHREKFRNETIPCRKAEQDFFHRGDVLVVNDHLAHYRGELEIVLQDMPNDGERNLVGRIPEEEFILLECLMPEHEFGFIQ